MAVYYDMLNRGTALTYWIKRNIPIYETGFSYMENWTID
jgi:hypothetical protein